MVEYGLYGPIMVRLVLVNVRKVEQTEPVPKGPRVIFPQGSGLKNELRPSHAKIPPLLGDFTPPPFLLF